METSPKAGRHHTLNPRFWTALSWLGVFLWLWGPFWVNYIQLPTESYFQDSEGRLTVSETYTSISEIPFRWGWPFSYIVPDTAGMLAGGVPLPTAALWHMLGVNIFFILLTTLALVYCSQKLLPRFSIIAVLIVTTAFALYFGLAPLVVRLVGFDRASYFVDALYFGPILGAIVIRCGEQFGFNWDTLRRSIGATKPL